mgnify:CR=1 FL=1
MYQDYPEYAEINGKEYKLNTDYRYALKCFEIVDNEDISTLERMLAIVYLIYGFIPDNDVDLFFEKAVTFLQCGETSDKQNEKDKDMDFVQDKKYINASFRSDYQIDLTKEYLHFWYFVELLQGLTDKCSLSKIRELRNYDTNDIKDAKEKKKIEDAKKEVALKHKKKKLTKAQKNNAKNFLIQIGIGVNS